MLRTMMLASAFALGLAGTAGATTITGTSSGAFTAITNCTASKDCSIGSGSGGTNNVLDLSGSNNGTLTGNNVSFTGSTPSNNVTIGSLTWVDNNANNFDADFGVTYTVTIKFTAPNSDTVSDAFNLTVQQASGSGTDTISGLTISGLPDTIDLDGVIVSDFQFVISGDTGSFSNDTWSLCGPGSKSNCSQTSTLLLEADFTADPTPVPEPMTLSLLGTSVIGVAFSTRRRRLGAR